MNFSQGLEPTAMLNYENVFILLETRIIRGNRDRKTALCMLWEQKAPQDLKFQQKYPLLNINPISTILPFYIHVFFSKSITKKPGLHLKLP